MVERIEHGRIIEPLVYQKVVEKDHFMVKYNGFGISTYVLKKLIAMDIKFIQFIYFGPYSRTVYLASTKQFIDSENIHEFKKKDLQKFVSVDDMVVM